MGAPVRGLRPPVPRGHVVSREKVAVEYADVLECELLRSRRWGHLTFSQVMDTLDRQFDALTAIKNDPNVPAFIRTLAQAALQ